MIFGLKNFKRNKLQSSEAGMALVAVVFSIAVATFMVLELGRLARYDLTNSRGFSEGVQAEYVLKSGLNLAQALLQAPSNPKFPNTDHLLQPWALVSSLASLPIEGFNGAIKLQIVDDDGKIDLNSVSSSQIFSHNPGFQIGNPVGGIDGGGSSSSNQFFESSLVSLFELLGFQPQVLEKKPGSLQVWTELFSSEKQVATLIDWIDADKNSFQGDSIVKTSGIESSTDRNLFYNRPLKTISEALLVPGISAERLVAITPFVKISNSIGLSDKRVNINTAPLLVLVALGFSHQTAIDIVQGRMVEPVSESLLSQLSSSNPKLQPYLKLTSSSFSIFVRAETPSTLKYLHAKVSASGSPGNRTTKVTSLEYF